MGIGNMKCKCCANDITVAEVMIYGNRCEECWTDPLRRPKSLLSPAECYSAVRCGPGKDDEEKE